jgi:hypothetical protein
MLFPRFELMPETNAVDVEGFEDTHDLIHRLARVHGPEKNMQIFFARGELVQNGIQKRFAVMKLTLEKPEISSVQFDPETFPLQMFHPASTQIALPMFGHPFSYAGLAKVVSRFLAFDPLVAISLFQAIAEDAFGDDSGNSVSRGSFAWR